MIRRPPSPARVLVTGFGPFPGVPQNASEAMMRVLADAPASHGIHHFCEVIPVKWADAKAAASEAIARIKPHAVLHFGVSKRLTCFEIETRAINISSPKEDHAGVVRPAAPLHRSGKTYLQGTLPPSILLRALRQNELPAQLSKDAGRYLCNALFYWSLAEAGVEGPLVSFIHLPAFGVGTGVQPRLTWEESVLGARILIRASGQVVLRAKLNGNGIRGLGKTDGLQSLAATRRSGRRLVWNARR